MIEENPLAQFGSSTSAAPPGPETEENPLAQFSSQADTTGEQAAPEDPEAGIQDALRNTWNYAVNVGLKVVQDGVRAGIWRLRLGAIAPATFQYLLAGPDGKKSWGQIYDQRC